MAIVGIPAEDLARRSFDVVVVGSGFGSLFFVHELLRRKPGHKIAIIEWGDHHPQDWQAQQRRNSAINDDSTFISKSAKPWNFTVGLGGGTNCWFGQTPRFHPNDFRTRSLYGIGADWPVSYDDLEESYCDAEEIMSISGDPDMARVLPRSRPFPQPPHRMSAPDRMLKAARPDHHFGIPTARARVATEKRTACCASMRCQFCPVDAKFTASNGMQHVFGHPDVVLALKTRALAFEKQGETVRSLLVEHDGRQQRITGDLFVLGANAIHSPAILEASGMGGGLTGKGLHESYGVDIEAYLDGVDNFDGSTITTGLDYGLYDGEFRSKHAGALLYFENRWSNGFRPEKGKWRQTLPMTLVVEELVRDENRVTAEAAVPPRPTVHHGEVSAYAQAGIDAAIKKLPALLSALPVEQIFLRGVRPTESHLQGTLRMGNNPANSVVDAGQVHHRYRNLVAVGSSVFATCSCANPSLTVAALSINAARKLV